MFWGEKTDKRRVKKELQKKKERETERERKTIRSLTLYKAVREGLSEEGAFDLKFKCQPCEDLGCNKIGSLGHRNQRKKVRTWEYKENRDNCV